MIKYQEPLAHQIRATNNTLRNYADKVCANRLKVHLTGIEGLTMGYLASHNGKAVSPSEIMATFSLKKATVSEACGRLVNKGFCQEATDSSDKRKKKYLLTRKGEQAHKEFESLFGEITKTVESGISEDERDVLIKVCEKLRKNAGEDDNE